MLNDNRRWIFCTCLYKGNMQKNLPCLKSEYQTIISLKNLLLSQTQVSFGNGYRAMVEQFHQFDKCEFWIFAVHIVHLSAKGLAEWPSCDHLRPIGNKSLIEWMRLQNKMRRYIKWAICVPTVLEIRQIELIYIPSVPKSLKSCTDGHSDKKRDTPERMSP